MLSSSIDLELIGSEDPAVLAHCVESAHGSSEGTFIVATELDLGVLALSRSHVE